jgi:hypothetical protein
MSLKQNKKYQFKNLITIIIGYLIWTKFIGFGSLGHLTQKAENQKVE